MTGDEPTHLDGNAAAGEMGELFAVDVTVAMGQCVGCGRTGRLAEAMLYVDAPGMVLRCRSCDGVLLRLVRTTDRAWLDLRGLTCLQLPLPS
jgi:hypothetical protein